MRKTIYLIAFMTAVIFNSCSSDASSSKPISESDLIGTWHLKSHTLDGEYLPNSQETYQFTSNQRVKITYPQDNYSEFADWTLNENNLAIHYDNADPDTNTIIYKSQI